MRTHSYSGRGFGGISTSGPENYNTVISKPNYFGGKDGGRYRAKNNGIKIATRKAVKKSKIVNPVI